MKKRQKHLKKVFADWAKTGGKKPLSVIIKDILKQRKRDSSNPRISGGATLEIIDQEEAEEHEVDGEVDQFLRLHNSNHEFDNLSTK